MVAQRRGLIGTARWGQALLPAGLFLVALLMLFVLPDEQAHRSPDLLAILMLAVMLTALIGRRRWPIAVLAVNVLVIASYQLLDYPPEPALPPVLVALYTVGSTGGIRRSLVVGVVTSALVVATFVAAEPEVYLSEVIGAIGWVIVALALGEAVRYHRAYTAEVEARVARSEAARQAQARQQAAQERVRIARDVHDVVAHSIAAINVQAGVAAHLIAESDQPDPRTLKAIGEILRSIAETSRAGVNDLTETLELLRGDEAPESSPVSGLAGVPALVEPLRAGGAQITVDILGRPRRLPQAHDVAAFRIVQEALTNAVKHGCANRIEVTVGYLRDAVRVTVTDHGPAGSGSEAADRFGAEKLAPEGAGGYGIVGMTERAHSVGGRLEASARLDGGFTVDAVLPLPDPPDAPSDPVTPVTVRPGRRRAR